MDNDEQEYFKALAGQLVSDVSSAGRIRSVIPSTTSLIIRLIIVV
ncbi:MAG: hypothetical protein AB2725_16080 [Candidatus Thiodiazotropha endolucinida]